METFDTIGTCYTKRYSPIRDSDDALMRQLRKEYLDLARLCALLRLIAGIIIGAATHHWWYHSF